jgi:hypothetical protein
VTEGDGAPTGGRAGLVSRSADWLFRNRRTGAITVAQLPNLPLAVFIAAEIAGRLVPSASRPATVFRAVAAVSLILWSLDEILRGVNPFRRILGLAVLVVTIASLVFH